MVKKNIKKISLEKKISSPKRISNKKLSSSPRKKKLSPITDFVVKVSKSPKKSPKKKIIKIETVKKCINSEKYQMKDKLHIVLDIDATLLETVFLMDGDKKDKIKKDIQAIEKIINNDKLSVSKKEDLKKRFHKIYLSNYGVEGYTILRPNIFEFLEFCNDFFKNVSIWTAGSKIYADIITDILFPLQKPNIIFSIDECISGKNKIQTLLECDEMLYHFNGEEDMNVKQNNTSLKTAPSPSIIDGDNCFSKPLIRIKYKEMLNDHKIDMKKMNLEKQSWFLKDIILVDDRNDTSQFNINNLVQISEFTIPKLTQMNLTKNDKSLIDIKNFFINIPYVEDIREYLRENKKIF